MGPVRATKTALRKTFVFSGRASRPEFWWFNALLLVFVLAAATVDIYLFPEMIFLGSWLPPFSSLVFFGTFLTAISVSIRRWHDSGISGYLPITAGVVSFVQIFVPINEETFLTPLDLVSMGLAIVVLLIAIRPSQPGPNKYGPNPHEVTP